MQKVLVAVSSKHGSTIEIARNIGAVLTENGLITDVREIIDVSDMGIYDAYVIGGAVYAGRWLPDLYKFIDQNIHAITTKPTWLFSSGPIGDPLKPEADTAIVIKDMVNKTRAIEHKLFAGKLDSNNLSLPEKLITKLFKTTDGDFRNWDEITRWAKSIAEILKQ